MGLGLSSPCSACTAPSSPAPLRSLGFTHKELCAWAWKRRGQQICPLSCPHTNGISEELMAAVHRQWSCQDRPGWLRLLCDSGLTHRRLMKCLCSLTLTTAKDENRLWNCKPEPFLGSARQLYPQQCDAGCLGRGSGEPKHGCVTTERCAYLHARI